MENTDMPLRWEVFHSKEELNAFNEKYLNNTIRLDSDNINFNDKSILLSFEYEIKDIVIEHKVKRKSNLYYEIDPLFNNMPNKNVIYVYSVNKAYLVGPEFAGGNPISQNKNNIDIRIHR